MLKKFFGKICGCVVAPTTIGVAGTEDDGLQKELYHVSQKYKIAILPIVTDYDLDNLYPITDRVEQWNIMVIGNDKTYILASLRDPYLRPFREEGVLNNNGETTIPPELQGFFSPIWDKTLAGSQLQFYIVYSSHLYFINTYPILNGKKKIIGAIMFMRAFETLADLYEKDHVASVIKTADEAAAKLRRPI
jgi:hypothetical protein